MVACFAKHGYRNECSLYLENSNATAKSCTEWYNKNPRRTLKLLEECVPTQAVAHVVPMQNIANAITFARYNTCIILVQLPVKMYFTPNIPHICICVYFSDNSFMGGYGRPYDGCEKCIACAICGPICWFVCGTICDNLCHR